MDKETEARFNKYIKALPPRSGKYEIPEEPKSQNEIYMERLIKELHNIGQELNTLNKTLRRK